MDSLLQRKDDSTNLIPTDVTEDTYVSISDIVSHHSSSVKVYMIRPGGILPACQPNSIKNQFCSIHVKDIIYEG